jgi:hypothetical protein
MEAEFLDGAVRNGKIDAAARNRIRREHPRADKLFMTGGSRQRRFLAVAPGFSDRRWQWGKVDQEIGGFGRQSVGRLLQREPPVRSAMSRHLDFERPPCRPRNLDNRDTPGIGVGGAQHILGRPSPSCAGADAPDRHQLVRGVGLLGLVM